MKKGYRLYALLVLILLLGFGGNWLFGQEVPSSAGFWKRVGNVLSPRNEGDSIAIGTTDPCAKALCVEGDVDINGTLAGRFIPRRDVAVNLDAVILEDGEFATTTDTDEIRVGDGSTPGGTVFFDPSDYLIAAGLDNWREENATGQVATGIAFGNGVFIAPVSAGVIQRTVNGRLGGTANTSVSGATVWQQVAFGNGTFVAVAPGNGVAVSSTEGRTWTVNTVSGTNLNWSKITYGSALYNTFVINDGGSNIGYSVDNGATWGVSPYAGTTTAFLYQSEQGLIIATAGSGVTYYTTSATLSGVTGVWTERNTGIANFQPGAVGYGNGYYIMADVSSPRLAISLLGTGTWTEVPVTFYSSTPPNFFEYYNGIYLSAVGSVIYASKDLLTWEAVFTSGFSTVPVMGAHGNGMFMLRGLTSGARIMVSGKSIE